HATPDVPRTEPQPAADDSRHASGRSSGSRRQEYRRNRRIRRNHMASMVVVAGVTSLYMSVGVEDFPLGYAPTVKPLWMRAGVAGAAAHIAKILRALGDEVSLCTLASHDHVGQSI